MLAANFVVSVRFRYVVGASVCSFIAAVTKMPPKRKPPKRKWNRKRCRGKKANDDDAERETFTIKCSLNTVCKNETVRAQIEKDVEVISRLSIEASLYIHYILYRAFEGGQFPAGAYDFEPYFNQLIEQRTQTTQARFPTQKKKWQ